MAVRVKPLTPSQKEALRANGLRVDEWRVVQDLMYSMIVRHRVTGEHRVIEKNARR